MTAGPEIGGKGSRNSVIIIKLQPLLLLEADAANSSRVYYLETVIAAV